MRGHDLPIMIGHKLKKGMIAHHKGEGFDLVVCWLDKNKEYESGQTFELKDIRKIEAVIHFCDKESVESMKKVLEFILKQWKESKE